MRLSSSIMVSAFMLAVAPSLASAADLHGSANPPAPVAGPTVNLGACPPPAVNVTARAPLTSLFFGYFNRRGLWVQSPRVVTVEQFEGVIPGPPKYVPPQVAFLASSRCPPSLGPSAGGTWYDGKIFYYDGTTPHRPDTFQIVVEPGTVRGNRRLFRPRN